jgi:hypothetical protein
MNSFQKGCEGGGSLAAGGVDAGLGPRAFVDWSFSRTLLSPDHVLGTTLSPGCGWDWGTQEGAGLGVGVESSCRCGLDGELAWPP